MDLKFAEMPKDGRFQDLTGQRFNHLTVVGFAGMLGQKRPYQSHWYCRCDCLEQKIVLAKGSHLKDGNIQSCGCLKKETRRDDLTGKRFDHWTVLGFGEIRDGKNYWLCRCDCPDKTERMVFGPSLMRGVSHSCGCHRKIVSAEKMRRLQERMKLEGWHPRTTHGMAYSAENRSWRKMKERCLNPKTQFYANYGGRGITICERWLNSFENFIADVGPRPSAKHSLDRIDVNGNYEPGNVRWADGIEQAANTRRKRVENFSDAVLLAELKRRGITS